MKILITLSLLFISCIVCKGQYFSVSDSSGIIVIGTNKTIDSAWLAKEKKLGRQYTIGEVTYLMDSAKYYYRVEKPKTDTVSVILLCSDTSLKKGFYTFSIFQNSKDSTENVATVKNRVPYVFWIFGYLVIETTIHSSLEHYLDADKNKLWKNIIVWKYIETE